MKNSIYFHYLPSTHAKSNETDTHAMLSDITGFIHWEGRRRRRTWVTILISATSWQ